MQVKYELCGSEYVYEVPEGLDKYEAIYRAFVAHERYEKNLCDGSARKWIQSKCNLYGLYVAKPDLFESYASGLGQEPINFYDIQLRKEYNFYKRYKLKLIDYWIQYEPNVTKLND